MAGINGYADKTSEGDEMKQLSLLLLLSIFSTGHAFAKDTYWGVDLRTLGYKSNGFEADLIAVSGKLGYKITNYFSIEGFAGTGVSKGTTGNGASSTKLNVDQILGIHLKAEYPFKNALAIYGIIGYSEVKLTANTTTQSATDSTSDTSYGAGVAYNLNHDKAISLDYVNFI